MVYMSYVQAAVYDAVTKLEGPLRAVPRLRVRGRSRRLGAGGGRGSGADDARLLPARPAADRRRRVHRLPRDAERATSRTASRSARRRRTTSSRSAPATASRRRRRATGRSGRSCRGSGSCSRARRCRRRGWRRCGRSCSSGPRSSGPSRRRRSTSQQYAKDLNETEAYGALNSTVRTPEQKAIAYFWVGNNINQYNQTMQNVVAQHGMDLVDAAHLLAMGEIVTTDAGIACFDSKFFYQFWRPITAIRNADKDGNPDTTADPAWQALLRVPGHPEYPSQHGCFTAAFTDALAAALAHATPRRDDAGRRERQHACSRPPSTSTPSTTSRSRSSTHGSGSASTSATRSSRVRSVGNDVADWELDRYFQPVHHVTAERSSEWPASARATRCAYSSFRASSTASSKASARPSAHTASASSPSCRSGRADVALEQRVPERDRDRRAERLPERLDRAGEARAPRSASPLPAAAIATPCTSKLVSMTSPSGSAASQALRGSASRPRRVSPRMSAQSARKWYAKCSVRGSPAARSSSSRESDLGARRPRPARRAPGRRRRAHASRRPRRRARGGARGSARTPRSDAGSSPAS